MDDFFNYSVII